MRVAVSINTTLFMDLSLSSSFISTKSVLFHPLSQNLNQRSSKFSIVSCRATKMATTTTNTNENLYKVLSLKANENLSSDEIKKAYRRMALQCHPDVCHPTRKEESARMFVELHKAYKVLSDPILRRNYDDELGLSKFERTYNRKENEEAFSRDRWEEQFPKLKRRSCCNRMSRKEGSSGSRMRAQKNK